MHQKTILMLMGIFTPSFCWFGKSSAPACPKLKALDKLDINKFMGHWYQYGSYGNIFIHGFDKCVLSTYSLSEDKSTIYMDNKRQVIKANTALNSVWKAQLKNANNPDGYLTVNLDIPVVGHKTLNFYVLGTDYEKYAVLYVCGKVGFIKFRAGYIFTRTQNCQKEELNNILSCVNPILVANNMSEGMFSVTQQNDCGHATSLVQTAISLLTHEPLGEGNLGTEDITGGPESKATTEQENSTTTNDKSNSKTDDAATGSENNEKTSDTKKINEKNYTN